MDTSVDYLRTGIENKKAVFSSEAGEDRCLHKNAVIVLAGGKSTRNLQDIPNQFINMLGKSVIICCLEAYRKHPSIDDIIIFQEATRPLLNEDMVSNLLNARKRNGSAVTCEPMNEYFQFELSNDDIEESRHRGYLNRHRIVTVQSPEAYRLKTVLDAFYFARKKHCRFNETCLAMMLYNLGYELQFYEGSHNNIKVVRQEDLLPY